MGTKAAAWSSPRLNDLISQTIASLFIFCLFFARHAFLK